MTTDIQEAADPVSAITSAKGVVLRIVGLIAGLAGTVLPAFTATGFGITQNTGLYPAAILPVLAAVALVSPGFALLRRYTRLIDILSAAAGILLLVYAAYLYVETLGQMSQMPGAAVLRVSISLVPSVGLLAIAVGAVVMIMASVVGRR